MKVVIDGENSIMGRVASFAAKQALQGKEVAIVNADKVFIIGNKKDIIQKFLTQKQRGKGAKMRGPIIKTNVERLLKRSIRGMMKYKEGRGKIAFKKIRCYVGVPSEFEKAEKISVHKLEESKKGLTLKEVSNSLKGI
jgi:large subunit ribosomal protein L13